MFVRSPPRYQTDKKGLKGTMISLTTFAWQFTANTAFSFLGLKQTHFNEYISETMYEGCLNLGKLSSPSFPHVVGTGTLTHSHVFIHYN